MAAGTGLDEAWVAAVVRASAAVEATVDRSGVVEFTLGKTKRAVLDVVGGRVTGPSERDEADVSIPVTAAQLTSFEDGTESMSKAFMRGDLKPVGSTGALLPVLALFDDPAFRAALAE